MKGAFAKEEWVGGKQLGESVMGNKICEMEIGESGWVRRDWRKGRKGKAKGKRQGNRARGQRKSTRGKREEARGQEPGVRGSQQGARGDQASGQEQGVRSQ